MYGIVRHRTIEHNSDADYRLHYQEKFHEITILENDAQLEEWVLDNPKATGVTIFKLTPVSISKKVIISHE